MQILYIFIGGGFGSVLRYIFSLYIPNQEFPYATFSANILASLFLGIFISLNLKGNLNSNLYLLLATGFCGGFSTFSTFAFENFHFLQNGQHQLFFLYTTISLIGGLAMVYLGFILAK